MKVFTVDKNGFSLEFRRMPNGRCTISVFGISSDISDTEALERSMEAMHDVIAAVHKGDVTLSELESSDKHERSSPPDVESSWVWESPRVKAILERPEGTPIDLSGLTPEERDALFEGARGMWVDHSEITDPVGWVRGLWDDSGTTTE